MSRQTTPSPAPGTAPRRPLARAEAWLETHPALASLGLYVLALGLRLLYLMDLRRSLLARVPLMDEAFYHDEAWSLLRGAPRVSDADFMNPLYPRFLALVFRLVGDRQFPCAHGDLTLGQAGTALVDRRLGIEVFLLQLLEACHIGGGKIEQFALLGELVEVGPTRQLFRQPQDQRTEDYITGRFG